jgi:hypothetical protein
MRKNLLLITILLFFSPLYSQVGISGRADISLTANMDEAGDYSSLLNPSNIWAIEDLAMSSSLITKLDAGDEKTTFSAWFSLTGYQMGQAFYALTGDRSSAIELADSLGDTIISFDIMRFSANVYLTDNLSMEAGRQSMLTGYGYGWNPIDFANPLKNPTDPEAALRGVDGFSFKMHLGNFTALKVYTIFPEETLSGGLDYEEIKAGGEMTFNFPGFEWKVAGFYDYDSTVGSDAYTPAAGTAFLIDLAGAGVYGEAALRKGSRNYFTDGSDISGRKEDWLFSVLGGLEYTFSNELYAVLEYFYNGEGLSESERSEYESSLESVSSVTTDLYSMYSSGYFARHYFMINLMQPIYDINTDLNLSVLFSPDSGALTVLPSLYYYFSGNFSGKLEYIGMFDLNSYDFSEVSAQPVKHILQLVFTYNY